MSSCFDCGSPVAPEDRFCGNCGLALQPRPGAEGGAASAAPPPAREPHASEQFGAGREAAAAAQDELQPTLIEASHGGQAAAPARASEPDESVEARASAPESQGLSTAGSAELSAGARK